MIQNFESFGPGDWVVHNNYGAVEIRGTEVKQISGQEAKYYKLRTHDGMQLWVPIEALGSDLFREITPKQEFRGTIMEILGKRPKKMASSYTARKSRIQKVSASQSLEERARLLRDLWGKRKDKSLNKTEQTAFTRLKERIITEWALAMNLGQEEAEQRLHALIE